MREQEVERFPTQLSKQVPVYNKLFLFFSHSFFSSTIQNSWFGNLCTDPDPSARGIRILIVPLSRRWDRPPKFHFVVTETNFKEFIGFSLRWRIVCFFTNNLFHFNWKEKFLFDTRRYDLYFWTSKKKSASETLTLGQRLRSSSGYSGKCFCFALRIRI